MINIRDVAESAEVSIATVSRVLNGNETVAPVLAERVRQAASVLGYRPNGIARNMRRQQTQVWALIITDVTNPFFTSVARGVEDVAQENDYSVVLCNSDEIIEKETQYLKVAQQERAAGVILTPRYSHADVSRLTASGIPLVVIDRKFDTPVDSVRADSFEGARRATQHLLDNGWTQPACITGPVDSDIALERLAGYRAAVSDAGIPAVFSHVAFHAEGGGHSLSELLESGQPVDSLFVANSMLALEVSEELKRRELVAGKDLGMVAYDDAPWTRLLTPSISVIAQPAYEIGTQAARLLVERIAGLAPATPRTIVLDTTLIQRDSSVRAVTSVGNRKSGRRRSSDGLSERAVARGDRLTS